jgi:phosphomannomutase
MLMPIIPDFQVRIGGSTSIDITRKGVDKGYGMVKLAKAAAVPLADILFVGDALNIGGNDHAVLDAGVDAIPVRDVEETKRIVETILYCSP